MSVNNFDKSSSGVDVEVNIYYSENEGAYMYDENFDELCSSDVLQYIDYGNIQLMGNDELFTINPKKVTKKDVVYALEYLKGYCDDTMLKSDLIDELYDIDFCDLYAPSWSRNKSIFDLIDVKCNFEIVTSKGYSQGDVRDVIIPHKLSSVWGCKKSDILVGLNEEIDHLLWDVPLNGEILIDGDEYYVVDYIDDVYSWNKDEFMASFRKYNSDLSEVVFGEIEKLLPTEIRY